MPITIVEFQKRFHALRERGFVKSLRRGPTGIGHTLEALLELSENNVALPDLKDAELKARRTESSSMVTLFTFNRKAWKMNPLEAVRRYGTLDSNGRLGLYFTMSPTPNGSGLFLHFEREAVQVRHIDGTVIADWQMEAIAKQFLNKIRSLVIVSANAEMRGDVEWFHYVRAQLLSGTSGEILQQQIREGNVLIDLRLHDQGTRARNHGTGFRAKEKNLQMLFKDVHDL